MKNLESKPPKNYQLVIQALGEADRLGVPTTDLKRQLQEIVDRFENKEKDISLQNENKKKELSLRYTTTKNSLVPPNILYEVEGIWHRETVFEWVEKWGPRPMGYGSPVITMYQEYVPRSVDRYYFYSVDPWTGQTLEHLYTSDHSYFLIDESHSRPFDSAAFQNRVAIMNNLQTQLTKEADDFGQQMQQQLDDNTARTEVEIDKLMNSSGFNIMTAWKNVGKVAEPQQIISQTNQLNQAYYPQKSSAPIGRRKPAFTTGIFKEKERE